MKSLWFYSWRLFLLNFFIASILGTLIVGIVWIWPGKPSVVYSIMVLFFFLYFAAWYYFAKWVHQQQGEVLPQASFIGFLPNWILGVVGSITAAFLALTAGKPSSIFVYSLLSLASFLFAIAGSITMLVYHWVLKRKIV